MFLTTRARLGEAFRISWCVRLVTPFGESPAKAAVVDFVRCTEAIFRNSTVNIFEVDPLKREIRTLPVRHSRIVVSVRWRSDDEIKPI